ncbi:hypothetical protein Tco_0120943 [Tanacetum coccineum]
MASSLDEFTVVINLSLHSPPVMGIFNRIHPLSPSSSFSSGILLRIRSVTYLRVIRRSCAYTHTHPRPGELAVSVDP